MKSNPTTLFLSCAALLALLVLPARAVDSHEVCKANDKFYEALNVMFTGDAGPMEAIWSHAHDVTYLSPDGKLIAGWTKVKADWDAQAKMKLGGKVMPEEIYSFTGDRVAVVQCWEVGENEIDGKTVKVKIRATNVFRKEDGDWKMISHHADQLPFLKKD